MNFKTLKITEIKLILLATIFLALFYNYTFFANVVKVYEVNLNNIGFLISLVILLVALNTFLFLLACYKYTVKPVLITIILISSLTSYFMNTYGVIIDDEMIRNAVQTNTQESLDLITIKQILYFVFLGIVPSALIYKTKIEYSNFKNEFLKKVIYLSLSVFVVAIAIFAFSQHYTSFFREHKPLRYNVNPTYWIYSVGDYIHKTIETGPVKLQKIAEDAKIINNKTHKKPNLTILVVGEAVRADHFSLNNYKRITNPLLEKEKNIINFSNFYSCGTTTAYSVPCMFSIFTRDNYTYKKGISTENILDVLYNNNINILWRENNSDSKGVALRVPYEDFKTSKNNKICNELGECRDEGMLIGLDEYISKKDNDTLIVLHQMGNHGPAYYKRYPKEFEKFLPVCDTNRLEKCTREEISNAYDNAILYTDYFLSKVINLLKKYDTSHNTSLIYMSDHGESLGENGVYLHGLPYFIAPKAQIHVAAFMWFGDNMKETINYDALEKNKNYTYSHDYLFHTLLGLFNINTKIYNKNLDLLNETK